MPQEEIYDARQADYDNTGLGMVPFGGEYTIGGLIGLASMALVGVGGFYTSAAARAVPATPLSTRTFTVIAGHPGPFGTQAMVPVTIVENVAALNQGQVQALALLQNGQITLSPGAIAEVLATWGIETLSLEGIIALGLYDRVLPSGLFGNMGNWLGGDIHNGPQFPLGFPGLYGSYPGQGVAGYYGCVEVGQTQECYWYH